MSCKLHSAWLEAEEAMKQMFIAGFEAEGKYPEKYETDYRADITDIWHMYQNVRRIRENMVKMVPENYIAWHAGKSKWKNYSSLNNFSIGIELQNRGHEDGYRNFKKAQINSLVKLCKKILKMFFVKNRNTFFFVIIKILSKLNIAEHRLPQDGRMKIKTTNKEIDVRVSILPTVHGEKVVLPSKFILPVAPMKGIVLNIPEMRLYYYPPKGKNGSQEVHTYPLGVGREGWNTPYIKTMIVEKKIKPSWHPPKSIRKEHEEAGDPLPKIVKPGPDNPLGSYAMRLGRRDYLIHGTNKPYGIGMRISHGCIRLYPEDIKELFSKVSLETPVNIINQPYKIGVKDDVIYLEAHPFLDEDKDIFENNLTSIISMVIKISNNREYQLDMSTAYEAIKNPNGLPIPIGIFLSNQDKDKKNLVMKTEQ